jgi:hypothetical protein
LGIVYRGRDGGRLHVVHVRGPRRVDGRYMLVREAAERDTRRRSTGAS